MRLFDAILEANHRAVAGDASAGVHVGDFAADLPVVALTCVDPRLNRFFPGVLGLPADYFIWLRNAGNIVNGSSGTTMSSIALACAIKGGREIAIIGHTDCKVSHTGSSQLIDLFKNLGIERRQLPDNLTEYFGLFASEQQNVIHGVDVVRHNPLIGPKIPVHGLIVDTATGRLDWVVNGYETLDQAAVRPPVSLQMPAIGSMVGEVVSRAGAELSGLKIPEAKIGEAATRTSQWITETKPEPAPTLVPTPLPAESSRRIPVPPRIQAPAKPGGSKYRL